jgi:hypothetical protein
MFLPDRTSLGWILPLPCYAVVLAMESGTALNSAVFQVQHYGGDGARISLNKVEFIAHLCQFLAHPGRHLLGQGEASRL